MRDSQIFILGMAAGIALIASVIVLYFALDRVFTMYRQEHLDRRATLQRHPSTWQPGKDGHVQPLPPIDLPLDMP